MNILSLPPISHAGERSSAKPKKALLKAKVSNPAGVIAALASLALFGIMLLFIPAVWTDHESHPGASDKKTISYAAASSAAAPATASSSSSRNAIVTAVEANGVKLTALSFWDSFRSNLSKPLLLFLYLGFAISLLRIAFQFPRPIYQVLTIYLLISIGWHGAEELSSLTGGTMVQALAFMAIGFLTNTVVGNQLCSKRRKLSATSPV